MFGRVFSNSSLSWNAEPEDGRGRGRPLTGRVKDGDGETVPPDAQLREGEKRGAERASRLIQKQLCCGDAAQI